MRACMPNLYIVVRSRTSQVANQRGCEILPILLGQMRIAPGSRQSSRPARLSTPQVPLLIEACSFLRRVKRLIREALLSHVGSEAFLTRKLTSRLFVQNCSGHFHKPKWRRLPAQQGVNYFLVDTSGRLSICFGRRFESSTAHQSDQSLALLALIKK